jgi:mannose-1-phosphate guanylyltransferase/phosphomannomutase
MVMRRLTEESMQQAKSRTDLIDGIKLTDSEREWVLVLPDAAEPVFHVYAEGQSPEDAQSRAKQYVDKIEALAS